MAGTEGTPMAGAEGAPMAGSEVEKAAADDPDIAESAVVSLDMHSRVGSAGAVGCGVARGRGREGRGVERESRTRAGM